MKSSSNGYKQTVYEFDGFRVDEGRKCIWYDDELVSITPKAFETLLVLIKNSGEVVTKDALLAEVWPETFVEESTLSQNILTLRKILGSFGSDKQFIVTVPRRGFRFVAPVTQRNGANSSNGHSVNGNGTGHALAVPEPVRGSLSNLLWAGAAALVVAILVGMWMIGSGGSMADNKFRAFRSSTLLSDASIKSAAISPDGGYVSLIERRENSERLLVRQIGEQNPLEIAAVKDGRIAGAVFSADSRYILYTETRQTDAGRLSELFRVPILGGARQAIVQDIDSPASISQSGKIAFVRRRSQEGDTQILIIESDGSGERVIAERKDDEGFTTAAISPDGSRIVAAARAKKSLTRPVELILIDTATGKRSSLTEQTWLWLGQSAWLADGSGIAVVAYGAMSPDLTDEVWIVSVPDGKARLLEAGMNGVFGVSLTGDGNSIAAVKSEKITSFVVAPISDLSKETAIVTKAGDQSLLPLGASWTADGRIIYSTTDGGNADIWTIAADGSDKNRLIADKYADLQPGLSVDGRSMYFLSNRTGQMAVWRSNADGSDPAKLTEGSDAFSLAVSPDGRHIYYTLRADSVFSQHLWRANADGSDAVKLATKQTFQPRISPDGKLIASFYPASENGPLVLSLLSAETGEVVRQFANRQTDFMHAWLPNGRELIALSRKGASTVFSKLSIETGTATVLRELPNEQVYRIALSPDGSKLFFERGVSVNNVLLLTSSN